MLDLHDPFNLILYLTLVGVFAMILVFVLVAGGMAVRTLFRKVSAMLPLSLLVGCSTVTTAPEWLHAECDNGQMVVMHQDAYRASTCTILNRLPERG